MHVNSVVHLIEKHWKSLIFLEKSPFPKKWQIVKIVQASSGYKRTPRLYPTKQVQSVLQPQISIHFAHFLFECKQWKMSMTRYSWEKTHSRKCYKSLYWWFKRTENFEIIGLVVLSTQLHEEMHAIKIIVLLEHEFWFHAVDFISGLTATKFLVRLNHESMNFETFSGIFFSHGYRVMLHSNRKSTKWV